MSTAKVSQSFSSSKYSDAELSVKANSIISKMTGNSYFPEPAPALEVLQTAITNYSSALDKVEDGSREDTVVKNNRRETLENLLKQLAGYVQDASGGDEAIILSSGFDVNKKPSAIGALEKATGLCITAGNNKGSVAVICDVVENARFYIFEYTEAPVAPDSVWTKQVSTKHKILIDGLTSGKQYVFRVAGAGTDPSRIWSDEISSFVL